MAYNTHTSRKREKALDEKSRDFEYTYRGGLLAELLLPPYCVKGARLSPNFCVEEKERRKSQQQQPKTI
jgi:hypothetical protein